MFAPLKRVALLSMASAGVWIVGCDDLSAADKAVQENLDKARADHAKVDLLEVGDDPSVAKAATASYKSAAGEKAADPAFRATAAGAAGDYATQVALAQRIKLGAIEQQTRATLSSIRVLAQQVALTNYLSNGYEGLDPKATVALIELQIKKMQGDANAATWTPEGGKGAVATIAGIKQEISRIDGEINQRKEQIATLAKEREAALALSEQKFAESAKQKRDEAVKTYTEAAEARKGAEERSVKIDLAQDQLNRLQADLAVAKGQEAATTAGIAQLQEQIASINGAWTDAKTRVANQKKIAESILNGDENVTISINAKTGELAKLMALATEKRNSIGESLGDAAKFYGDAAIAGGEVGKDKRITVPGPSAKAYKDLKEALHPGRYNLPLANVLRVQGSLAAGEARLLFEISDAMAPLKTALSAAGLTTPSDLPSVETQQINSLIAAADKKLIESKEKLDSVIGGDTPPAVKNEGLVSRLITLYALISLEGQKSTLGLPAGGTPAAELLADARDMKTQIVNAGALIPALPGELGEAPLQTLTPTPAPTPAPTATPASPAAGAFGAPSAPATPGETAPGSPAETPVEAPAN